VSRLLASVADTAVRLNDRVVAAASPPGTGRFLEDDELPAWCAGIVDSTAAVEREVGHLLDHERGFATLNDVTQQPSYHSGRWDVFVLVVDRKVLPTAAARCPATVTALRGVPRLQFAFFSIFRAGVRLDAHRDPNKATYRYLLPLRAPADGSSGLRLGGETRPFRPGGLVAFDHTAEHEAWNDSAEDRVALFLEVGRELPFPASATSWVTNRLFDLHPATRGARRRVAEYDAAFHG
jgi:aspartyl/asparaginyl beta-hydroxylase (cupin superfamily)